MTKISLVYMLAGLSSRFGGKAKALARVGPNNETLLEYSLDQALLCGFAEIIFIVSKKTEPLFKEKFGNEYKGIPIKYALQDFDETKREKPWGTTDALCSAKKIINNSFIVCNGDDIYGKQAFKILSNHLRQKPTDATLGYKLGNVLSEKGSVNRGIFKLNLDKKITNIIETLKITPYNLKEKGLSKDSLCGMNIFALTIETLELLQKNLELFKEEHKNDSKIECFLPSELNNLIQKNKINLELYMTDEKWFGLTNPEDEFIVKEKLKELEQFT
jgi:NDP-sugar pyrophosphorylase family protein